MLCKAACKPAATSTGTRTHRRAAGKGEVQASMKDETRGCGYYFPLTAAQRFDLADPPKGALANAVYIPHVAALQFTGDYTMSGVRASRSLRESVDHDSERRTGPHGSPSRQDRGCDQAKKLTC